MLPMNAPAAIPAIDQADARTPGLVHLPFIVSLEHVGHFMAHHKRKLRLILHGSQ